MSEMQDFIRKQEFLLEAERLKAGKSSDWSEGFDMGASWAKDFAEDTMKGETK